MVVRGRSSSEEDPYPPKDPYFSGLDAAAGSRLSKESEDCVWIASFVSILNKQPTSSE
jgi:hypothetical protein